MTFLHPALLYLLPLAVIPVVLHLLTLPRPRTIELSTFRFLFESYQQQRRRLRLFDVLLALLRVAFLVLLVLLVGRPVVQTWAALFPAGSGREVVLLVDCSASMATQTAGKPAIERARETASTIVERLSPDDHVTLVRVTSRADELCSRLPVGTTAILDRIAELKAVAAHADLLTALTQVVGADARKRTQPLVYCLTDGQASSWGSPERGTASLPAGMQLLVVNVGSREPVANMAVVGEPPPRSRALVGLPVELRARIAHYPSDEAAEATLRFIVDDQEAGRTRLSLPPGAITTHTISYVPTEPGLRRCRFEITGNQPDRFADDDRYRFTLAVQPRLKVVLVNGRPAPDPLDSETLYLKTALTMERSAPVSTGTPKPDGQSFQRGLELVEVVEGALGAVTLRDAGVVILANCGRLTEPQWQLLRTYLQEGGGVLVLPGDRVDPDAFNAHFAASPGVPDGLRLGPAEGDADASDTLQPLARIDFTHPALSIFDDKEGRYLRSARFARRFRLVMPERRDGVAVLAEFGDRTPALVEAKCGEGRLLLAAFPGSARWSNLPLKPEFVPLLLRLVEHLQRRAEIEVPSVVAPETAALVSVAGSWAPVRGSVTDAPERPGLPLEFKRSGTRETAAFADTAPPGYYTVEISGGSRAQSKHAQAGFAVNLAPEESDFTAVSEQQLRELLPGIEVKLVDASAQAVQQQGDLRSDREVWRPFLWLALAVFAVEFLMATGKLPVAMTSKDRAA